MAYLSMGQQVLQLIKDNFGSEFNAYFFGDPHLIGKSSLPAVIVEESDAETDVDYTQMDTEIKTIQIKIVHDKRDDWGASDTTDLTYLKIREVIDGRDPTTGQYLEKSLKGLLRTNFTLSNNLQPVTGGPQPYVVAQKMKAQYYINQRPEDTYTQEGRLTLTGTELIIVPNRT